MLDVVLYRHDRHGILRLQERLFASFGDLARFFASSRSRHWEWAEVTGIDDQGKSRVIRYQAETLRSMVMAPNLEISLN